MVTKNDALKGELVRQVMDMPGWEIVLTEITFVMNDSKDRLLRTDPTDSIEICKLQERYRSMEKLVNNLNSITKEV